MRSFCPTRAAAPGRFSASKPSISATLIRGHGPMLRNELTAHSDHMLVSWPTAVTKIHGCHGSLLSPAGHPALSKTKDTSRSTSKPAELRASCKRRRCFNTAWGIAWHCGTGIWTCPAWQGDIDSNAWKACVQLARYWALFGHTQQSSIPKANLRSVAKHSPEKGRLSRAVSYFRFSSIIATEKAFLFISYIIP